MRIPAYEANVYERFMEEYSVDDWIYYLQRDQWDKHALPSVLTNPKAETGLRLRGAVANFILEMAEYAD